MGFLEALDFHKKLQSGTFTPSPEDYEEVEYQLHSWGELFPPFAGNREHSIAARFILREFPFKLFSSTTPYEGPLPYKLCVTFKAPHEVKVDQDGLHIAGVFSDEIADGFCAFLSLVTRRRIFISKQTRCNDLPIERETDLYPSSHFQERQYMTEIDPAEIYQLLENLQNLDRSVAQSFLLAMRLYHSAIQMMYTEPDFSYLFLVTCLEAISSAVNGDYKPDNEDDFLNSKYPGWRNAIDNDEQAQRLKESLLQNEHFTFGKLRKFVIDHTPEEFWTDTEDNAKPKYVTGWVGEGEDGLGKVHYESSELTIPDSEKIEKENLKRVLRDIYNARSELVHEGVPLPASIVMGHFRYIPLDAHHEMLKGLQATGQKQSPRIPPLLTFERLVSYSLTEFLRQAKPQSS